MTSPIYCFYHANCFDGTAAAAAVKTSKYVAGREAYYVAVDYRQPVPDFPEGATVIVVDFYFQLEQSIVIIKKASEVIFLDHHETYRPINDALNAMSLEGAFCETKRLTFEYDETRSGALMTWEHFHRGKPVPQLIKHVSDRDLWKFELEGTEAFSEALGLTSFTVDAYVDLLSRDSLDDFYAVGQKLLEKRDREIDYILDLSKTHSGGYRMIALGGEYVPLINCPRHLTSALLAKLCKEYRFAVSYYEDAYNRVYSIRSPRGGPVDVSKIATSKEGGGGHRNAAGWKERLCDPDVAVRYLEQYIDQHDAIAQGGNLDLRAEEITNLKMWVNKLRNFATTCRKAIQDPSYDPKKDWW